MSLALVQGALGYSIFLLTFFLYIVVGLRPRTLTFKYPYRHILTVDRAEVGKGAGLWTNF